jgi:hypothetical protein
VARFGLLLVEGCHYRKATIVCAPKVAKQRSVGSSWYHGTRTSICDDMISNTSERGLFGGSFE